MHLAPLNNSVVFKKLFRDPEIVTAFVKDLIGVDLEITAENIELEKQFIPPIGAVDIKIDIFVQDPKHRLVIEIQRQRYDYHYDRFLYYHNVALVDLVRSYHEYRVGHTVYTIVWLPQRTKDPFLSNSIITSSICSETTRGERLPLYPHKLYFLNPFYVDEYTPPGVADWMRLVSESIENPKHPNINIERPIFDRATDLIVEDGISPQERALIFEETGYESHLQKRKEEGIQIGREIGREEGMEKGMKAKACEIAHAMLAQGLSPTLIAQVTGLTPDEVEQLQQSL